MNWYKLAFRGNIPRINDIDEALQDPYKKKNDQDPRGTELNTFGDQSTTEGGTDYYDDKQPPKNTQQLADRAIGPHYNHDTDGEDPQNGDFKQPMHSGDSLYDTDSPIGNTSQVFRDIEKPNLDRPATGPNNMTNRNRDFFSNLRQRVR